MHANAQTGGVDMAPAEGMKMPPLGVPAAGPNVAMGAMGVGAAMKVIVGGGPAHTLQTSVPMTLGLVGMGGVASSTVMAMARPMTAVSTALAGGVPWTRTTSQSLQNLINTVGVRLVPSQLKVLLLKG